LFDTGTAFLIVVTTSPLTRVLIITLHLLPLRPGKVAEKIWSKESSTVETSEPPSCAYYSMLCIPLSEGPDGIYISKMTGLSEFQKL